MSCEVQQGLQQMTGQVTFVTFSHPSQFKSRRTRHAVRSYVTKKQHQEARSKQARLEDVAGPDEGPISPDHSTDAGLSRVTSSKRHRPALQPFPVHGKGRSERSPSQDGFDYEARISNLQAAPKRKMRRLNSSNERTVDTVAAPIGKVELFPATKSQQAYMDRASDLGVLTAEDGTFPDLENSMLSMFDPLVWSALRFGDADGMVWERWLHTSGQKEVALSYARLLVAAGHSTQSRAVSVEATLMIQDRALASIFEALADPSRKQSDALILAIGYLAFYECMFGDRQAAHTLHRPAQREIIELRGGFEALALPAIGRYTMQWADTIMSLHGSEPMLGNMSTAGQSRTSEAHRFQVLSRWLP